MTFSKVTIFPGDNRVGKYSYQVELKGIILSKLEKMGKQNIYSFLELRRNSYCNTYIYLPETVLIHAGINDALNSQSQENINIKYSQYY